MVNTLKDWQTWATAQEQEQLASAAGTSPAYLFHQLANGHRQVSASLAGKLEAASRIMHETSSGRLPVLTRMELCEACAECPYAKACKENVNIPLT
jgi:hypothetical protein